jgi:hypothetical protein
MNGIHILSFVIPEAEQREAVRNPSNPGFRAHRFAAPRNDSGEMAQ